MVRAASKNFQRKKVEILEENGLNLDEARNQRSLKSSLWTVLYFTLGYVEASCTPAQPILTQPMSTSMKFIGPMVTKIV